jgi:hypothetical protein
MDIKFTDIIHNNHFQTVALVLRTGWPVAWRQTHSNVPYWTLTDKLKKVATAEFFATNRTEIINRFFDLFNAIVQADPRIQYGCDDLDWFVSEIDKPHGLAMLWLMLAWVSAVPDYLTPLEIADATATAESTWRNKAAAGELPGAVKKGKQWLIPRWAVRGAMPDLEQAMGRADELTDAGRNAPGE